jgi:hypothetical protein
MTIMPLARPLTDNRVLRATGAMSVQTRMIDAIRGGAAGTAGRQALDVLAQPRQDSVLPRGFYAEFDEQIAELNERIFERSGQIGALDPNFRGTFDDPETIALIEERNNLMADAQATAEARRQQEVAEGRALSPEQLAERYADMGMTFPFAMTPDDAEAYVAPRRAELIRQAIASRSPGGVIQAAATFGAGLVAMATDPLELATNFIPIVSQARMARLIGRFGQVGGRVAVGAIEGAVGQAITEPVYFGLSRQLQLDYGMTDALFNVGLGLAFGSVVGGAAGALTRAGQSLATQAPQPQPLVRAETPAMPAMVEGVPVEPVVRNREAEARQAMVARRDMAETALRQFVTDQPIDFDGMSVVGEIRKAIRDTERQLAQTSVRPIVSALRRFGQINPDGDVGRELKAMGITARSAPGLFSKQGASSLDNLPASEWEEIMPGISQQVGVENGYLSQRGLIERIAAEIRGEGRDTETAGRITEMERDAATLEDIIAMANQAGFKLRDADELWAIRSMMDAGQSFDDAIERLAIMSEGDIAARQAENGLEPYDSLDADARMMDDVPEYGFADFDNEITDLQRMVDQIAGAAPAEQLPQLQPGDPFGSRGRVEAVNQAPLYRDTSPGRAWDIVRNDMIAKENNSTGQLFWAQDPDLALGQGGSTGIILRARSGSLGVQAGKKAGSGEFVSHAIAPKAVDEIVAVTQADADAFFAKMTSTWQERFNKEWVASRPTAPARVTDEAPPAIVWRRRPTAAPDLTGLSAASRADLDVVQGLDERRDALIRTAEAAVACVARS